MSRTASPTRPSRGPRPPVDRRFVERRRAIAAAGRARRRRITVSLVVLAVLTGLAVGVARSPLFGTDAVDIEGVEGARVDQVRDAAAVPIGDNLLAIDLDAISERVERLPWVEHAETRRAPPATVVVAVTEREPVAVVWVDQGSWIVDADGVVLDGGEPDDLLVIQAPSALVPGLGSRISDERIRNALAMLAALPADLTERVTRVDAEQGISSLRLRVTAPSGDPVWVRVGRAEDVATKATVIAGLLEHLGAAELAADAIDEIDVRVPSHPVVRPRP